MEEISRKDNIVLLFNLYDMESQNLHTSFKLAGYDCPVIVIEDDGFVPDDVISVYGYYMGDYSSVESLPGKPLYFNQVDVPEYWEISSNGRSGKISDKKYDRGYIYFTFPQNKRMIKSVDWLDDRGIVRLTDHYNQYGGLYARTIFNAKGERVNKSFFSPDGKEVIVENYVTGAIILNDGDITRIFHSKTELVVNFFEQRGLESCSIYYNSLSVPFFVSERLKANESKSDILFWQESERPDIPGNMRIILENRATRTEKIYIQKKHSYDRFIALGADENIIQKLGYIYPFQKTNQNRPEVLICTNSDQIEQLTALVEGLPEVKFHIAALTEMSSKLLAFGSYENVRLYPAIKEATLDDLFVECDYYLDVNHQNEIVNAVCEAFLYNQVVFAFAETIHNRDYIADEHIYRSVEVQHMIEDIKACISDPMVMDAHLVLQQRQALAEINYDFK